MEKLNYEIETVDKERQNERMLAYALRMGNSAAQMKEDDVTEGGNRK